MKSTSVRALSALLVMALAACGGGGGSPDAQVVPDALVVPPDAAPAPTITSFTATYTRIRAGREVELSAEFTGGTGTISGGVGAIPSGGTVDSGAVAQDTTFTLTVTNPDGLTVSEEVAIDVATRLWVVNYSAPSVSRFDAARLDGDVAPIATLVGPTTALDSPSGVLQHGDQLFVSDQGAGAIFVYDNASTLDGDVAPVRTISGPTTTLDQPRGMTVVGTELYVVGLSRLLVFPLSANGDMAPTRSLSFPGGTAENGIDLRVVEDEVYVTVADGVVHVFPVDGNGGVTPLRSITGPATMLQDTLGVEIVGDELFVSDDALTDGVGTYAGVAVYPLDGQGDIAPTRTITGAATLFGYPGRITAIGDELFVAEFTGERILSFSTTASGDIAPSTSLFGVSTVLDGPWALTFVD